MMGVGHWRIGHSYRFGLQAQCQQWLAEHLALGLTLSFNLCPILVHDGGQDN
jgi:hypothetical protein